MQYIACSTTQSKIATKAVDLILRDLEPLVGWRNIALYVRCGAYSYTRSSRGASAVSLREPLKNVLNTTTDDGLSRMRSHLNPVQTEKYLDEIYISPREPASDAPEQLTSPLPSSLVLVDVAAALASSLLEKPPKNTISKAWEQAEAAAGRKSYGYNFFHTYGLRATMLPLKNSSWQHVRLLRSGMWDLKRVGHI